MSVLTALQRRYARHALGLPNERGRSYRNRFFTSIGVENHKMWSELATAKLAKCEVVGSARFCFWLTRAGAEAALEPGETLDPEDFPE